MQMARPPEHAPPTVHEGPAICINVRPTYVRSTSNFDGMWELRIWVLSLLEDKYLYAPDIYCQRSILVKFSSFLPSFLTSFLPYLLPSRRRLRINFLRTPNHDPFHHGMTKIHAGVVVPDSSNRPRIRDFWRSYRLSVDLHILIDRCVWTLQFPHRSVRIRIRYLLSFRVHETCIVNGLLCATIPSVVLHVQCVLTYALCLNDRPPALSWFDGE